MTICNDPDLLRILIIFKMLLTIIQFAVPVIGVIVISFSVIKAVSANNQENISKVLLGIPKKVIAIAIVFLVPALISLTLGLVESESKFTTCFQNATEDGVKLAYVKKAEESVVKLENTKTRANLNRAESDVNKVEDEATKTALKTRIAAAEKVIEDAEKARLEAMIPPATIPDGSFSGPSIGGISGSKSPYYKQCDGSWSYISSVGYNTCECGCGYTSLAMIASGLNKSSMYNPPYVVKTIRPSSYSKCAIDDAALASDAIVGKIGLDATVLFSRGSYSKEIVRSKILPALRSGSPIIILVPGHYIVLDSIKGDKITVLDPGNSQKNGQYTFDQLWSTYNNYANRCRDKGNCGIKYAISYTKK